MAEYQVVARKYRPRFFREVLSQDAVVTTLKNAIRKKHLANAYLFCGPKGTGKTTLARVLAKALNCQHPTSEFEPCDTCASCREIASGHSMDVLEIDGASHRGIDDIRQINETVGYATTHGKYKIYIIDEVHMLTKEAFNALLKTLEEPPPKVKFFFATTEPHKVPATILSRCQRFDLKRISADIIIEKLKKITLDMGVSVEDEALRLLAQRADGGLRDAESMLDQVIAFHEGKITVQDVATMLGVMPRDCFFALDRAGKENNLAAAFDIAHSVYSQGKDIGGFLEGLLEHFRNILAVQLAGKATPFLSLSETDRNRYVESASWYSQEQCLYIIDSLMQSQNSQRSATSERINLEATLLNILRSHQRIPADLLVKKLAALEQKLAQAPTTTASTLPPAPKKEVPLKETIVKKSASVSEDPTPTPADLGISFPKQPAPIELGSRPTPEAKALSLQEQSRYDTLMHFAAVELEGTVQKEKR